MTKVEELTARASELGYQLVQGPARFSGYMLIGPDGEKPLGDDHRASLRDVEKHLTASAADAGLDLEAIEISGKEPSRPSAAALHQAIKGRADAAEIEAAMAAKPAPLTLQERRIMRGADRLFMSVVTPQQQAAFDKMSDADKEAYCERLRTASQEVEAIEAKRAQLPKPSIPLRETGINPDHPFAIERARQRNVFAEANWQLYRTNLSSRGDVDPDNDDGTPPVLDDAERDPDEYDMDWQKRCAHRAASPPELASAPDSSLNTTVTITRPHLSKEERQLRRADNRKASDIDKIAEIVRALDQQRPTPQRNAKLSVALAEAKAALGSARLFDDFLRANKIARGRGYDLIKGTKSVA